MRFQRYECGSIEEATPILNREWSPHRVEAVAGTRHRVQFSIRSLTPSSTLSRLSYGTTACVRPVQRAGVLLLQVPLAGQGRVYYDWGSLPLDPEHICLVDAQEVNAMHCDSALDMLVVRMDKARVATRLGQLSGRADPNLTQLSQALRDASANWQALQPSIAAIKALDASAEGNYSPALLAALEEMVLEGLVHALPHQRLPQGRHDATVLPRHVVRAQAVMRERLGEPLNTPEIARLAGVSVRSLFDSFRHFVGESPSDYLKRLRLDTARDELCKGDGNVVEISRRCGFRHGGHFAAAYRACYGESPLQTRRKAD